MNTDSRIVIPDDGEIKLLFKEDTHSILGCAFELLNELGHGWNEKIYENSLTIEFRRRQFGYDHQLCFRVEYKSEFVGEFIPDLIAYSAEIVDPKATQTFS